MNRLLAIIKDHPYAIAAGSITAAELLRSRTCERSVASDAITLVAIAATVNAGMAAAHNGAEMLGGATRNPYRMASNPFTAPSGRLTGLPVVKGGALAPGVLVTVLADKRGGRPQVVGISGAKGVGVKQVVVRGRDNRYHLIEQACGGKTGKPGRALAQGGYKGCDPRNAGRVLGLKSWRDSSALTTRRTESSLRNLMDAFKKRGLPVPASVRNEYLALKTARTTSPSAGAPRLSQRANRGAPGDFSRRGAVAAFERARAGRRMELGDAGMLQLVGPA